jgi:Spy/CpxP family protein refolding chaperone
MKTKVLIGILIFLIVVNLATIGTYVYMRLTHRRAFTEQPGPPGGGMPPGMPGNGPMAQLTEDQRHKLFDLMSGFHEETYALNEHAAEIERETFKLLHEDPVPQEKVDARLKEISDIRLEISRKAAQKLVRAKEFLAPEQQERFFGAIMQSHQGIGGPPMRGGDMPPPPGLRRPDSMDSGPPPGRDEHR